jgi:hypothetical protein
MTDIDTHRSFATIRREIVPSLRGITIVCRLQIRRAPSASIVTGTGTLNLDDLRTQISEDLRTGWAGQDTTEI